MSHYRKIDTRIWNDEKFNRFSDRAKLLFLFLLTHPNMTPLGAMRMSLEGLAGELHWSKATVKKAFDEIILQKVVMFDCISSFLWLPKFLNYNKPSNPKMIKSWESFIDLLPECELKNQLIQAIAEFAYAHFDENFLKALPIPFRYGMAYGIPNRIETSEKVISDSDLYKDPFSPHHNDVTTANAENPEKNNGFFILPTSDGGYRIDKLFIDEWKKQFTAIDVMQELNQLKNWILEESKQKLLAKNALNFVIGKLHEKNGQGGQLKKFQGEKHGNRRTKPTVYESVMCSTNDMQWAKQR